MKKIKLYIAMSLNGKIAKPDGSVDWLNAFPNPDKVDHGYAGFYDSIDTTIQGYSTYKQVRDWGIDFPYKGKTNYVFTQKSNIENTEDVSFISKNHIEFVKGLKKVDGKDIWLIGGGQINTMLLNERLIDELYVFVMPIVISNGISLFESLPKETMLKLLETLSYPTGVVELRYEIEQSKLKNKLPS